MEDSALKEQYRRLQEQQKRKLERLRDLQNGKNQLNSSTAAPTASLAFGVTDDLDLKGKSGPAKENNNSSFSEDDLRQLKDENGRLYKLLSEKDCEIRAVKRKLEQRAAPVRASISETSITGVGGDVAAVKIMNLSKKIRDLTCDLEAERTKTAQLSKRCSTLESEGRRVDPETVVDQSPSAISELTNSLKQTKDKLKQTESRLLETRNQHQIVGQELKLAMKALGEELGGDAANINIHEVLSGQSNWRGRQQKIITLQTRVKDLERQITDSQFGESSRTSPDLMVSETCHSGATSFGRSSLAASLGPSSTTMSASNLRVGRQREAVVKLQKARQEALERAEKELKVKENESEDFRKRSEASKARCKVLSNEVKTMKDRMTVLLEKGRHDDELIASLLKQHAVLQGSLEAVSEAKRSGEVVQCNRVVQLEHENKVSERLKEIIAEKEREIVRLQEQIGGLDSCGAVAPVPTATTSVRTPTPRVATVSRGVSPQPELVQPSLPPSVDLEQTRTLLVTAEVERDRLRELTLVQERRSEDMISRQVHKDQEMTALKRRLTTLERQIQRLGGSLPLNSAVSVDDNSQTSALLEDGLPVTKETIDALQRSLALSLDETVALKQAVKRALEAKQEDLKMLTDIVGQTRAQFMQGIRNIKEKLR